MSRESHISAGLPRPGVTVAADKLDSIRSSLTRESIVVVLERDLRKALQRLKDEVSEGGPTAEAEPEGEPAPRTTWERRSR